MGPRAVALGSPVVCLPAPVSLPFAVLSSEVEKYKSTGLDSVFLKNSFIEI